MLPYVHRALKGIISTSSVALRPQSSERYHFNVALRPQSSERYHFNVALRPRRPYGILRTGSEGIIDDALFKYLAHDLKLNEARGACVESTNKGQLTSAL